MSDSCKPLKGLKLNSFRIYSIIIPTLLFILAIEAVMIFASLPTTMGSALSVSKIPSIPGAIKSL